MRGAAAEADEPEGSDNHFGKERTAFVFLSSPISLILDRSKPGPPQFRIITVTGSRDVLSQAFTSICAKIAEV